MKNRRSKTGLPPLGDETQTPLVALEPQGGFSIEDEIARCRETQDNPLTADDLGTAIMQFKVEKPKRNHYFQVMPPPEGKGYLQMFMIEGGKLSGVPKNWYCVSLALAKCLEEYGKGIRKYALVPTIDRDGNIRVWPHSLASEGQAESWYASRCLVIAEGVQRWIRYEPNTNESRYEIITAKDQSLKAKWPLDLEYEELVKKAIGDHYVGELNHPVVRSLRGDSLHSVKAGG
jgi:hypothetical protein